MKIIELAEKQRNNETLPKHIRYEDEDLYFDGVSYYDKEGNNDFFDIFAMNNSALTHLYDEIEIIEEDKEYTDIEEIKSTINGRIMCKYDGEQHYLDTNIKDKAVYVSLLNALIRNQKYILEQLNKEVK